MTSGPYRLVRHPIYSGILIAGVGTAIALSWLWLVVVVLAGVYFVYSATVEERYLTEQFPTPTPTTGTRPGCWCRSSSEWRPSEAPARRSGGDGPVRSSRRTVTGASSSHRWPDGSGPEHPDRADHVGHRGQAPR